MLSTLKASLVVVAASSVVLSSSPVAAHENFEYPELLVTPRASERIEKEARNEEGAGKWLTHLPVQASALTLLAAGVIQSGDKDAVKDPDGYSALAGLVVGGGWLVTTAALSAMYQPYTSAQAELATQPAKTPREQLLRERNAEERIEAAARLGRKLTFLSVITNLGTAGYMIAKAKPSSLSMVADGVAAAMSVAPLLFRYRWQQVARDQQEYKKKIYAPIASAGFLAEPGTGNVAPAALLSVAF